MTHLARLSPSAWRRHNIADRMAMSLPPDIDYDDLLADPIRRFAQRVRLLFALALVALEFTNIFGYLTFIAVTKPQTKRFALHYSPFALQFLGYGICLMVVALDRGALKRLFGRPIFRWVVAATIVFTWGMLLRTLNPPAGIGNYSFARPFALRINALVFLLSCVLLMDGRRVLDTVKWAVAIATLVAVVVNLYEIAYPGVLASAKLGRAGGLYVNPNEAGMAIVFGTVIGLTVIPRRWRELFLLATGAGVAATFSREALAAFAIVIAGGAVGRAISWPKLLVIAAAGAALIITLDLGSKLEDNDVLTNDNTARLTMTVSDSSSMERYRLAKLVLEKFEEAPLLGNGFDTAGYWSDEQSHNLYLSFMADHGIFGILLIPALVLSLFRKSWNYYSFAAAFLLWCAFDHNLFSDSFALISLAIQASEAALWRVSLRNTTFNPVRYVRQTRMNGQGSLASAR